MVGRATEAQLRLHARLIVACAPVQCQGQDCIRHGAEG